MLGGFINLVLTTDTYKDLLTGFGRLELSLLHQKMALKQGHRLGSVRDQLAADPYDHRILAMCSLTTFPVLTFDFYCGYGPQF